MNPNTSGKVRTPHRSKVLFESDDPLSKANDGSKVKKENLSIRLEDESRISASLINAAKKQTTGSIFSIIVDISKTGTLGVGVKDLSESILAVSLLKRHNGEPGAGEEAGIRLGDIIFGINFIPTREGSKTLINVLKKEIDKKKHHIHIQAWRCHQLCSDSIPGYQFPRADDVLVQAFALYQSKVFSDWERWNFIEILLGHMIEDLKIRTQQEQEMEAPIETTATNPQATIRARQMQVLDLERNILQAKGLRTALCVRIVHTKMQGDAVVYVLRLEDVESGLQWVVHRRYRDFYSLHEELLDLSSFVKEIEFPKKRLFQLRNTLKLVESRIVALEQYTRKLSHHLTIYATMDFSASKALRHLQSFLGVDRYVDCVHPPPVDDQRFLELMAYRFLNDFSSPACQQCIRFITTVDLDESIEPGEEGYRNVLQLMRDALAEVEQFVLQQHQQQMIASLKMRRPDFSPEQLRSFVRKCIRRQVEAALFLPLRRQISRIVYGYLAAKSREMQKAVSLLQQAQPSFLTVNPKVLRAKSLPRTVKAFRKLIQAYLPADQGQLLMQAAVGVADLHKECCEQERDSDASDNLLHNKNILGNSIIDPQMLHSSMNPSEQNEPETQEEPTETQEEPAETTSNTVENTAIEAESSDLHEIPAGHRLSITGMQSLKKMFSRDKSQDDLFSDSESDEDEESISPNPSPRTTPGDKRPGHRIRRFFQRKNSNNSVSSMSSKRGSENRANGDSTVGEVPRRLTDSDVFGTYQRVSFPMMRSTSATESVTSEHSKVGSRHPSVDVAPAMSSIHQQLDGDPDLDKEPPETFTVRSGKQLEALEPYLRSSSDPEGVNIPAVAVSSLAAHGLLGEEDSFRPSFLDGSSEKSNENRERTTENRGSIEREGSPFGSPSGKSDKNTDISQPETEEEEKEGVEESVNKKSNCKKSEISKLNMDNPLENENSETGADPSTETSSGKNGRSYTGSSNSGGNSPTNGSKILSPVTRDPLLNTNGKTGIFEGMGEQHSEVNKENGDTVIIDNSEGSFYYTAVSADDFLPLFTFVLVRAGLPQLLLVKELMVALVDDEDLYGECGYYLATLEAAIQHILDLAKQYESVAKVDKLYDDGEEIFDYFDEKMLH